MEVRPEIIAVDATGALRPECKTLEEFLDVYKRQDAEWGPKNVVRTGSFPVRTSFGDLYEDCLLYTSRCV